MRTNSSKFPPLKARSMNNRILSIHFSLSSRNREISLIRKHQNLSSEFLSSTTNFPTLNRRISNSLKKFLFSNRISEILNSMILCPPSLLNLWAVIAILIVILPSRALRIIQIGELRILEALRSSINLRDQTEVLL